MSEFRISRGVKLEWRRGKGAVIKCFLRSAELLGMYLGDTAAAFQHLQEWLVITRGTISATGKRRHTIGARAFVHVKLGDVNHDGPEVRNARSCAKRERARCHDVK